MDCVDENALDIESSDSDDENGHNQESNNTGGSQTVNKLAGKQDHLSVGGMMSLQKIKILVTNLFYCLSI